MQGRISFEQLAGLLNRLENSDHEQLLQDNRLKLEIMEIGQMAGYIKKMGAD